MAWVKSEYAGELAVVSAWIAATLPWYVAYAPDALRDIAAEEGSGAVLFVRWPFFQVRYVFGVPLADGTIFSTVFGAKEIYAELGDLQVAYWAWYAGAAVLALALLLSFAMYAEYGPVEDALPFPPVRVMGGLLGLGGVCLTAATVLFYTRTTFEGIPVPIGLLVVLALAGILLRVDLVDADAAAEDGVGSGEDAADAESGEDATDA